MSGIPGGMNPIAIGNGGTNATTAPQALRNLGGIGTDSPAFTGTPTAPTAPAATNTTQLATTAFVKEQNYGVGTITGVAAGAGLTGGGTSGAVTLALTTGVNPNVGTFQGLTLDTYGRVTAAVNQNYLTGNQVVTLSGDVVGSGATAITTTLSNVNANVGSFASVTVNGKGLVTAAAPLSGYGTTTANVLTVNRVRGVADGSNAAAGDVGEYVSVNVASSPGGAITSATPMNMASIPLAAGDWDVGGNIVFQPAATTVIQNSQAAISTVSASFPDSSSRINLTTVPLAAGDILGAVLPVTRVNIATAGTAYLVAYVAYTTSTLTICGNLWARRMR
jgi:hypothetical protein